MYVAGQDYKDEAEARRLGALPKNGTGMKPSVGRVVHYVSYGTPGGEFTSQCRAAIITEVTDDSREHVSLAVLNPSGMFFNQDLPHNEIEKTGGSWHWPERVE